MISRIAIAASLVLAIGTGIGSVDAQNLENGIGDRGVYTTQLTNGLKVIVVEDHAAPVVHTAVWYRFGSLYETPGKTGLAHALEHMMFRGTPALSAGGLDDAVARLGGQMNGQTDYDYTQFTFDMPSDKAAVALQIEADRMQHLALEASEWAVERLAVLNELDGDASSPFYNLLSRVRAAAYPATPAGRTPIGVRADVASATVQDIRKYYEEWYAPNNAALVVAGDIDHAAIFSMAQRIFGAIPRRSLPSIAHVHPIASSGQTVEAQFPFPFEVLDMAYAIPGDTEPGEPAMSTLASLIPNQLGPFYQALVETNIALALDANADTQLRGGLMHIYIVLNPGHSAGEAATAFANTMTRMLQDGFDPQLVRAAQRATLAERAFNADSIDGYGDLVGYTYGIVGERDVDEDSRLAALTPADVLAAARTYLTKPTVVGHLTPNENPSASGASQKSSAAASDNFTGRVPNGPIRISAALRTQIGRPTSARSKLQPVSFTLPNGLEVIVQEKHDRPTVYIAGAIAGSPAFAPSGKEGIVRLASALADFGSEQYDFATLRKVSDDMGASIHLGEEFSAQGFARDFPRLLAILADGEEHPAFPDRWFSLQQSQLANSVQTEQSISGVLLERAYQQNLFAPSDPSLRFATQTSILSLTRDDLLRYTKAFWRPDLTTIAIVGDITVEQARAAVTAAFGGWQPAGDKPSVSLPALPPAHTGHAFISTAANQVFAQLGQPAVSRSDPNYDALSVLNEIIGGSGFFQSRLWQKVRQKRGLVYSVSSELRADGQRGDLEIDLNASPANTLPAITIVRDQLELLRTHPVSQTELDEAKLRLISSALLSEGSAQGQLSELLDIAQNRLDPAYFSTLSQRYAAISAADIQAVANRYLRPDRLIQVFAGPAGPWSYHVL